MARPTATRPVWATRMPAAPVGSAVGASVTEGTSPVGRSSVGKSSVMGGLVSVGVSMMMVLGGVVIVVVLKMGVQVLVGTVEVVLSATTEDSSVEGAGGVYTLDGVVEVVVVMGSGVGVVLVLVVEVVVVVCSGQSGTSGSHSVMVMVLVRVEVSVVVLESSVARTRAAERAMRTAEKRILTVIGVWWLKESKRTAWSWLADAD
jgi:hypothetical protein